MSMHCYTGSARRRRDENHAMPLFAVPEIASRSAIVRCDGAGPENIHGQCVGKNT